jgi:hypothetical protein
MISGMTVDLERLAAKAALISGTRRNFSVEHDLELF